MANDGQKRSTPSPTEGSREFLSQGRCEVVIHLFGVGVGGLSFCLFTDFTRVYRTVQLESEIPSRTVLGGGDRPPSCTGVEESPRTTPRLTCRGV